MAKEISSGNTCQWAIFKTGITADCSVHACGEAEVRKRGEISPGWAWSGVRLESQETRGGGDGGGGRNSMRMVEMDGLWRLSKGRKKKRKKKKKRRRRRRIYMGKSVRGKEGLG